MSEASREIDFRLLDHPSPPGQLLAADAEALSRAVQTLIAKLTRAAAGRSTNGRLESAIEVLSRARLSLHGGSTVVRFSIGDSESLEVDPLAHRVDEDFWAIVQGMHDAQRPSGVSDTVALAVEDLVKALKHAAGQVVVTADGRPPVRLATAALRRDVWHVASVSAERVAYVGWLRAVDLESRRFRLHDDAGNRITLKSVRDPDAAGRLLGGRVVATGTRVLGAGDRLSHLEDVVIERRKLPGDWKPPTGQEVPRGVPSPHFEPVEMTDEELDAFLAAIRE